MSQQGHQPSGIDPGGRPSDFFCPGEESEKPLAQRVQEKPKKTLRNSGPVENFEDLHLDLGTRRAAPQTLLNSVHGVNLEDFHQLPAEELDCQRSAQQSQKNVVLREQTSQL